MKKHNITNYDNIIFAKDKSIFGLDYLLDDYIKNVERLPAQSLGFLYNRYYNRKESYYSDMRVNSIEQYINIILVEEFGGNYLQVADMEA